MGYKNPTPIQEQAIPVVLNRQDLIACAQTGTGKTAAYLLPVMHQILQHDRSHVSALIIAPTRELAVQIDQQIVGLSYFSGISSIAVYGGGKGSDWDQQKKALKSGADIIIATPGRLIALLAAADISLQHLRYLILDEADRMLDMGFYDDIVRIVSYVPTERQTLLFSATMPPKIRALAGRILVNPAEVSIAISKPAEGIRQQVYHTHEEQKIPLLLNILKADDYQSIILFASTKDKVKELDRALQKIGLSVKAFHSDMEQDEREVIMRAFKNRQIQMLVGTDILSRGIDVDGIDLVINFNAPPDPEDYIHRIGRTARAARTGTAITLISERDLHKWRRIEKLLGYRMPPTPLPEEIGVAPVLQEGDGKKSRPPGERGGGRSKKRGGSGSKDKRSGGQRNAPAAEKGTKPPVNTGTEPVGEKPAGRTEALKLNKKVPGDKKETEGPEKKGPEGTGSNE